MNVRPGPLDFIARAIALVAVVLTFTSAVITPASSIESVVGIQYVAAEDPSHASVKAACTIECSIGSGVIVPGGYVITAAHVIENTNDVSQPGVRTILTSTGKHLHAKVLKVDTKQDVAILKIDDTSGLSIAFLVCDPGQYAVGDNILVRGNPLFLGVTTTYGRIIRGEWSTGKTLEDNWPNAILLDAQTTYGNSGGPVYDSRGRVIAILVGGEWAGNALVFSVAVPAHVACELVAGLDGADEL
jgi:S1-C subfamily serine protease